MKKFFAFACAAMLLSSCAVVSTGAGMGVLYTGVTEGGAVTSNPLGTKVGTSQECSVLGLVATGDASITTAAKAAGIKKISHIDVQKFSVLGIYSTYTTVVYGE